MAEILTSTEQPNVQEGCDKERLTLVARSTFLDGVDEQPTTDTVKHSRISEYESMLESASTTSTNATEDSGTNSIQANTASTAFLVRVLPSVGSAMHFGGDCCPCSFALKSSCKFGYGCSRCHFPHVVKARLGKNRRLRQEKALAKAIAEGRGQTPSISSHDGQESHDWSFGLQLGERLHL